MVKFPAQCDVLVVGDEVESILTAVSAARAGAAVVLARRSTGRLGGLSVRGGLSYMDITPEYVCGLFKEFLDRAGLVRVALNPGAADKALREMLKESGITVVSSVEVEVAVNVQGFPSLVCLFYAPGTDSSGKQELPPTLTLPHEGGGDINYSSIPPFVLKPQIIIDATPDADIARALGVPYLEGLGGLLGEEQNFLGVSPVFRITGVPYQALQAFEAGIRENPDLPAILEKALPWHPPELRKEYLTRPTFAPPEMDYLDILSPIIGIDYHCWRHGDPATYPTAEIFIDGANISRLADGSLGFNGLVARAQALDLDFGQLIALSQGGPVPDLLLEEMRQFERYLREKGGFAEARVIPPEEMYVRQTLTLLSRRNMTARQAIGGGVPPECSVGTFSYWLDLRGTSLWKIFPGEDLPKPVFNVGLDVALPLVPRLSNFGFIGRSAGYSPIGQGTGRIVQHNAMLGEGLGVAAALTALSGGTLAETCEQAMPQIQEILKSRRDGELKLEGRATWPADRIAASELLRRDEAAIFTLRERATDFSLI